MNKRFQSKPFLQSHLFLVPRSHRLRTGGSGDELVPNMENGQNPYWRYNSQSDLINTYSTHRMVTIFTVPSQVLFKTKSQSVPQNILFFSKHSELPSIRKLFLVAQWSNIRTSEYCLLTLGSMSSGDRHLLTVLLTTSSNIKWTKLERKIANML